MKKLLKKLRSFYQGVPRKLVGRLLAAPFVLSLLDLAVTLYFQPAAYWNGDRSVVVEGNPLARLAFSIHPLAIIPGFIGWYALVFPLIFKSPAWIGLRVHVLIVLGHLTMISGWLIRNLPQGLLLTTLVLVIALPFARRLFAPFRSQWESRAPLKLPQ